MKQQQKTTMPIAEAIFVFIRFGIVLALIAWALGMTGCTKSNIRTAKIVNTDTIVPGEFLMQMEAVNSIAPNVSVDSISIAGVMYNVGGRSIFCSNVPDESSATIVVYAHLPYSQQSAATCYYTGGLTATFVAPVVGGDLGTYILQNVSVNNSSVLQFAQQE
jgi:hypothetical protein